MEWLGIKLLASWDSTWLTGQELVTESQFSTMFFYTPQENDLSTRQLYTAYAWRLKGEITFAKSNIRQPINMKSISFLTWSVGVCVCVCEI